ncbi:MAG: PhoU domain-containing protein [Candidatus Omnitrophica bacterium]|nr:PhoU domain-containing protein [Candidatus Omnitrophota bacterium]
MADLNKIKEKIAKMSEVALGMWRTTHQAFMEHDMDLLEKVLEDENRLNNSEKEIVSELVAFVRETQDLEKKNQAVLFTDIVGDLEMIGDYCKDILERVQIKIEERLLFSEEAVVEYGELYKKTEDALEEINRALVKDSFLAVGEVLKKQEHIDSLVDEYRKKHNERMITGSCSPMACNMYLNMLDFTAAVYYHTKKIAKNLLKIK